MIAKQTVVEVKFYSKWYRKEHFHYQAEMKGKAPLLNFIIDNFKWKSNENFCYES